ncbi:hypothetical protein RUND412_003883 [Rhizina undulata]
MKWDAEADQHLLLAILCAHKVCVDYTRVSAIIGCTPRACEERLKKLRKHAKQSGYDFGPPEKRKNKGLPFESKIVKGGKGKFDKLAFAKEALIGKRRAADEGRAEPPLCDDGEVKIEPKEEAVDMRIKLEAEVENFVGGGIADDEAGPLMKRRKVGMATFFTDNAMPYASTADGVNIPLGIPLEIANTSISYASFSQLPPLKPGTLSYSSKSPPILPPQSRTYRPNEISAPNPISAGLRSTILPPPLMSSGTRPRSPIIIDSPPPIKEGRRGDINGNRGA